MQTKIHESLESVTGVEDARDILRACVHCGFCNATCPTYLELGDERDGPRGRIYLIRQFLETGTASSLTQRHLDRCLTCRSCETTCPSGVEYGKLADIGRELLDQRVQRPVADRMLRKLLRAIVTRPPIMRGALAAMRALKPVLPARLRARVPARQATSARPPRRHERIMLVLEGCAQSVATPATNDAAARVLDKLGISLVSAARAGCCGALSFHTGAQSQGLDFMRRNIDAWWPQIERGAEAIVVSASGCGVTVREYAWHLRNDAAYAEKAERVSALARDLSEIVAAEPLAPLGVRADGRRVAVHTPCSLQHGQKLTGTVEGILRQAGYELAPTTENHICCGSAGSYSETQPELSDRLLRRKLNALTVGQPDVVVTANVGCQLHLASGADMPVRHWIELL